MQGKLYLCATPIGNLGDITYRCVETLKMVDLIAAEDTRRTLGLLNHLNIEKPLTSYYEHNRREKGEFLVSEMKNGKNIALVSDAGTPAISDPGEDLVALCAESGIDVVPIPGAVAGINALIASGLPTGRFAFEGFLSVNKKERAESLEKLKNEERTLVFYEAPHKLKNTIRDMYKAFGNRKISFCRELTKVHEEFFRTTLEEAIGYYEENQPRGEFVLIVEGKNVEDIKTEEQNAWMDMTISEHVEFYLSQGIEEKEALRNVAKDRGVSRRDIYNEYKR